ncbi:hypothetical protein LZY01_06230 [Levilactobacillus zymae]|uniref:Uncharacterized protein n=1 Tax=Levilactobacillus zymae TaxID=267363 RepID=A0ABQ0WUE6_9LACO|nr:hypothetical protein FD38_GL001724 [Levilactobacillus zymae DSM 19395]GEO71455.1 hypothetical protein LZY01_06230 [Levilactobacillus zymae]
MAQDPKKSNDYYRPGPVVHPKKYSSSGGLADWGPLLKWFGDSFRALWRKIKK